MPLERCPREGSAHNGRADAALAECAAEFGGGGGIETADVDDNAALRRSEAPVVFGNEHVFNLLAHIRVLRNVRPSEKS